MMLIFLVHVVFPIKYSEWLTHLFLVSPYIFSLFRTHIRGGRSGVKDQRAFILVDGSGVGESHLVGDII